MIKGIIHTPFQLEKPIAWQQILHKNPGNNYGLMNLLDIIHMSLYLSLELKSYFRTEETQAFPTVERYYMTLCYNKTVIDVVHRCLRFVTVEQRRSQLNIFCCMWYW